MPSNFTFVKIQDGGRPPFKNKQINRHNSAALQDIFTKFGMQIDIGQLRLPWCQISLRQNSRWRLSAFWKFNLMAITQALLHKFTQNLAQREKPTSSKQKYLQISLLWKSKMAAGSHFKNTLIVITRPPFKISSPNGDRYGSAATSSGVNKFHFRQNPGWWRPPFLPAR